MSPEKKYRRPQLSKYHLSIIKSQIELFGERYYCQRKKYQVQVGQQQHLLVCKFIRCANLVSSLYQIHQRQQR
jgi:hypothetical protein